MINEINELINKYKELGDKTYHVEGYCNEHHLKLEAILQREKRLLIDGFRIELERIKEDYENQIKEKTNE
jgi:hypothetical protein